MHQGGGAVSHHMHQGEGPVIHMCQRGRGWKSSIYPRGEGLEATSMHWGRLAIYTRGEGLEMVSFQRALPFYCLFLKVIPKSSIEFIRRQHLPTVVPTGGGWPRGESGSFIWRSSRGVLASLQGYYHLSVD